MYTPATLQIAGSSSPLSTTAGELGRKTLAASILGSESKKPCATALTRLAATSSQPHSEARAADPNQSPARWPTFQTRPQTRPGDLR